MVKIIKRQVKGLPVLPWARGKPTVIVAHETANNSNNGQVQNEINYMANHWGNAFYHYIAGENGFYEVHNPDIGGAWGAGHTMHNYAIHVELARSSTKSGFNKAYAHYVNGIKYLAKKYGIPLTVNKGTNKKGVYTHHYVTRKFGGTTHTDPDAYFRKYGKTIRQFAKDLKGKSISTSKWKNKPGKWKGKVLRKMDKGRQVRDLQTLLYNAYPRYIKKSEIDGMFGKIVNKSVRTFQADNNLSVDGVPGRDTYNKLQEVLTVSEYNKLNKQIKSLKRQVNKKMNKTGNSSNPSDSHQDGWDFITDNNISQGGDAYGYVTRQQLATMLKRYDDMRFVEGGEAGSSHEGAWQWLTETELSTGGNPHMPLTREQFATLLLNYNDATNIEEDSKDLAERVYPELKKMEQNNQRKNQQT